MSRERALRRAEREAALEAARRRRAAEVARRDRRRTVVRALGRPFRAAGAWRRRRPDSPLRRHRARQNGTLLAVLVALNGLLWLTPATWTLRGAALVLSVLAWPLLVVLVFDRRRSS